MLLRVEKGMSHREDDFSLRMRSFSPRESFLPPTRSEMTPKRKTAMVLFASSSIPGTSLLIFRRSTRTAGQNRRKKTVGPASQPQHCTIECMARGDKAAGNDLFYGGHVGRRTFLNPMRLEPQAPEPVLLVLPGDGGEPASVAYSCHEREEDGQDIVPEAPVKEIGSQGVDSAAVGAAKALDPEGQEEAFKVSLDIPVAPEAGRPAGQAALGPRPGVFLAELK